MKKIIFTLIVLSFIFKLKLMAAHLSSSIQVIATCTGAAEVPAVETDARGLAVFTLNPDRSAADFFFLANGLSGDITGIHLHSGQPGENGGVVINLTPFLNGNTARGTISNTETFAISSLLAGEYYLNVHTAANPGGEIRGQALLESDLLFAGEVSGANEVTPVLDGGSGFVMARLNQSMDSLQLIAIYEGFTGLPTGMHLHNGPLGANGGVVVNLTNLISESGFLQARVDASSIASELLAGNIYLNIHTAAFPAGEARGQLLPVDGLTFDALLEGAQEVPAVETEAKGAVSFSFLPASKMLIYHGYISNTSSAITGAHLHLGTIGQNGGVVVNLTSAISNGYFIDTIPEVTQDLFEAMMNGSIYLNIHTENNPSGEIRGQVYKNTREGYFALANGGQEVPPVTTEGQGLAALSVDRNQDNAHFSVLVNNLTGDFSAAHFHNAGPGENGGVIFNLTPFFDDHYAEGYWTDLGESASAIRTGEVYLNVHTSTSGSGEIRGNLIRGSEFAMEEVIDPNFSGQLLFAARVDGSQEVPSNPSGAFGVIGILLDSSRTAATLNVSVAGLEGDFTGAHLHRAARGENGGVVVSLTDYFYQNRISTTIDVDSALLADLMQGLIYLNVHTSEYPGGEIRGQLTLEMEQSFTAVLSGSNEVPAVEGDGSGLAAFHLNRNLGIMRVNAMVADLTGPITGAHLHVGASGSNGGVEINLTSLVNGNRISGAVDASAILGKLDSGLIYLNIHTEDNPGGEVRGQLSVSNGITFDGWLSGAFENPPVASPGSGLAVIHLDPTFQEIVTYVITNNASGPFTGAHLHLGDQSENGGVWINLSGGINGRWVQDTSSGFVADNLLDLLRGDVYVNLHTAAFPGGELRAQAYSYLREGYNYDLCPEQEVSAINNAPLATGGAITSVDRFQTNLHLMSVVSGMTNEITGFHIHNGAIGENGGVILNLTDQIVNGGAFLYHTQEDFAETIGSVIAAGNAYLNVHTSTNPGGEVRGQIVKELICPDFQRIPEIALTDPMFGSDILITARLSGDQEVPAVTTDGVGLVGVTFNEDRTMATFNMTVSNLSSSVTGVHIHEAPAGQNGGVLVPLTDNYDSGRLTAEFAVNDTMISNMINGNYYVNVHTENNAGGEIRGQLRLEAVHSFAAMLSGDQEVPAVETSAQGLAVVHYNPATQVMEINFQSTGLSGPITGAHFHQAVAGENGGVVENLTANVEGNSIKVKITPGDYISSLMSDSIYLNIHTAANPGGEIRGQLNRLSGIVTDSWLNGAQEVPAAANNSIGLGLFVLDGMLQNLDYHVVTDNLTGMINASHLHNGALGNNGGVVLNLSDGIDGPVIRGSAESVESTLVNDLLAGQLYANVHTEVFPGGEIRGQLYRLARDGYSFDICQSQEVDIPVDAGISAGSGIFGIGRDLDEGHLMVVVNELSSDFAGAHIHEGAEGTNGGVFYNFTDQFMDNAAFLYITSASMPAFDESFAELIQSGNAYVNIHTANNPGGEIRGQIVKSPTCPLSTDVVDISNQTSIEINAYPNPTREEIVIDFQGESRYVDNTTLRILDMQGRALKVVPQVQNNRSIPISELPAGLYIFQLSNEHYSHSMRVSKIE